LSKVQKSWIEFLDRVDASQLEIVYTPTTMTYYENIHGIIQHDVYHLGQIVLLSKQF
jgi:uncharacterized damage-inducible protein DinB